MRRAAKIDGNQTAIVDEFHRRGYQVQSLATVGIGVPDLLVCTPSGDRTFLVECKIPGETFTPAQVKFHKWWRGEYLVLDTVTTDVQWPQSAARRTPR